MAQKVQLNKLELEPLQGGTFQVQPQRHSPVFNAFATRRRLRFFFWILQRKKRPPRNDLTFGILHL